MKKTVILVAISLIMVSATFSQKVKVVSGEFSFLKSTESINVEFVYPDDMRVGKVSQQEYIANKKAKAEESEPGKGKAWEESWYADRTEHFEPRFMTLLEKYLGKKDIDVTFDPANEITMIVKTTFIEPGFNVGIASRPAFVNLEITFVEGDAKKELAVLTLKKSPGASTFDAGLRMGEAYAKAGKTLAKVLIKKAKL